MKNVIFILSFLLIFLTSCSNEEIDINTRSGFSIQQRSTENKSTNDTKNIVNPLEGNIEFTKVIMGVRNIELKTNTKISGNKKFDFEGPYQFNVLTGTSTPPIEPVSMEPGIYHKVAFEFANVLQSGNSFEIYGTFVNKKFSFDFEYTTDMEGVFEIKNKKGIEQIEGDIAQFILYLDLKGLFIGADINNISFENNIVKINASSNTELASVVKNNLQEVMDFERELD